MKFMVISSICDSTLSFRGAFKDLLIWGSDAVFWSPGEAEWLLQWFVIQLDIWGGYSKTYPRGKIWGSDARFWSPGEAEAGSGSRVRQRHERPVRWGRGKRPGHQWPPVHCGQVTSFTSPLIMHYILSEIHFFFSSIWFCSLFMCGDLATSDHLSTTDKSPLSPHLW